MRDVDWPAPVGRGKFGGSPALPSPRLDRAPGAAPAPPRGRRGSSRSAVRYSLFPVPYSLLYRLAPEGRDVGRICTSFRADGVAARPPIAVSR